MQQEQRRSAQNREKREEAERYGRDGRRFPIQVRAAFIRVPRPAPAIHR